MSAAAIHSHPLAQALRTALQQHRDAVLQAPTGAGKSTLVPLALLDEPWARGRKILMLEPRRLAARAVAARMASTLGEPVGATVGVRMRLDTRVGPATRIEVVTEGVLTRLLQADPALESVACVIFDEFHERSLQADLGLALCLDARRQLDTPLRVLVMSATLEGARVAALLDDAPVVDVPGRSFPVEMRYLGRGAPLLPGGPDSPERALAAAVRRALGETAGDVLAFLPGAGEIRRTQQLLDGALPPDVVVLPLYGELPPAAQDAALAPARPGQRKVVLATNIAETSLTIPGVTVVVDGGLVRRARFDPGTGMSRLETERIARDSAQQRAGRAGRTAPGICYRLWGEGAHAALAAFTPPEILQSDLAALVLELARWGCRDAATLDWLDAPPAPMLAQAHELLARLGAFDAAGRINEMGRAMTRWPLHPRLAHMLVAGSQQGAGTLAAELSALLSERDLLRRREGEYEPDVAARLALLRRRPGPGAGGGAGAGTGTGTGTGAGAGAGSGAGAGAGGAAAIGVDRGALERVRQLAAQLARSLEGADGRRGQSQSQSQEHGHRHSRGRESASAAGVAIGGAGAGGEDAAGALLALAYPDRIGRRRGGAPGRYLLANGRGAAFRAASSLARSEYIVALELDDREREARIDLAAHLEASSLEALFADRIITEQRVEWDERAGAVLARQLRRLDALILEERALQAPYGEALEADVASALLGGIRSLGLAALPWDEAARALQARMQFVGGLGRSDLADWPDSSDAHLEATLEQWLAPWLAGITRREQWRRVDLGAALRARLTAQQLRRLEELAPREFVAPSGSHRPIDYGGDHAPRVSVRLQEMFGLAATPGVGGGAVPLTFELLSPAQRPVQVTRDLAGFWKSSYHEVRRELRGRYPKHDWPEDPLHAPPRRGARRVR